MATEHPRCNYSIYEQMVNFVVERTGQPRDKVREVLLSQEEIECQPEDKYRSTSIYR
uniref:Uncharacterized protein n=1 Tax=Moniliophthora roreri TaxID=221103 RepID=A0A0W0G882_MONRR